MSKATYLFLLLNDSGDRAPVFHSLLPKVDLPHQLLTASHTDAAAYLCRDRSVDVIFLAAAHPSDRQDSTSIPSEQTNKRHSPAAERLTELIAQLERPHPPIVVIGQSNVRAAVAMMQAGAAHYLERDRLTAKTLRQTIQTAIASANSLALPTNRKPHRETPSEKIALGNTVQAPVLKSNWHESKPLLRAMIKNFPGGAVFVVDRDLRYLLAEGEALHTLGLTPADLVGKTVAEWLPNELVDPCVMRYQQALAGESFEHEHAFGENSYLSRGTPLRSETGEIYAALAVSYDISTKKQAEVATVAGLQAMKRLHNLSMQTVVNANTPTLCQEIMAAAIALTNAAAGCFQAVDENTQELVMLAHQGFDPGFIEQFIRINNESDSSCGLALATKQRVFVDFEPETERSSDVSNLEAACLSPPQSDETRQRYIEAGLLSAQSTPLLSRSGKLIGMVSTHWRSHHRLSDLQLRSLDLLARQAADLVEQHHAEAERKQLLERERTARVAAERANRTKDEFLSVLSHELRSPLNPILGWASLLQSKQLNQAQTERALASIERNVKLQAQLVDDLLDVARILRGKLKINNLPVNLLSVTEAAIEVVSAAAKDKSISLHKTFADRLYVEGDPARLQQIVWNLLSNAIKFTPAGGRVDIRLAQTGDLAEIAVIDNGKGISPAFLPHLFESFRQESVSINRQFGGLGLGLSIVQYLVEAHGGNVAASSPGEGKGATFTVQLPVLPKTQSPSTTATAGTAKDTDLSGIKVLAVDDSADTRELLIAGLSQYGATVEAVASGSELLAGLEDYAPDVLLCDIGMPGMDGYTLLQQVRAHFVESDRSIPAIAVTAYAREEDRQRALEVGFERHITKPIEPGRLARAIEEIANG